MNIKDSNNLDLLDMLSVMSFYISLENLSSNLSQNDKQDLQNDLSNKADLLLKEIHSHLEQQDAKIELILKKLEEKDNGDM